MNTTLHIHECYTGFNKRKSLIDIRLPEIYSGEFILFTHGFMGFMDWGCWPHMQDYFLDAGYGFARFNISHNGTTPENPTSFSDLEAFSVNSYSAELFDVQQAIQFIHNQSFRINKLHLIGHSRGGGIALLAGHHPSIHSVITLAAISSIERRFPVGDELAKWKKEKTRYIMNGRTNQRMPLSFSQYEDFLEHQQLLSIENACSALSKPTCIIHGDEDTSVPIAEGEELAKWLNSPLIRISGADHTFGSKEPWEGSHMPALLMEVCQHVLRFIQQ
jgi:pimeloyl-ACP methyl ester carboxylesterase